MSAVGNLVIDILESVNSGVSVKNISESLGVSEEMVRQVIAEYGADGTVDYIGTLLEGE